MQFASDHANEGIIGSSYCASKYWGQGRRGMCSSRVCRVWVCAVAASSTAGGRVNSSEFWNTIKFHIQLPRVIAYYRMIWLVLFLFHRSYWCSDVAGFESLPNTGYPEWHFCGFSQSLQVNFWIVSRLATTSSFQILSNSSFVSHPIIRRYTV
jgi:hypothetical protein